MTNDRLLQLRSITQKTIPKSQIGPVHWGGHVHLKDPTVFTQVPLFRHGYPLHSLSSVKKFIWIKYCTVDRQFQMTIIFIKLYSRPPH